jgi:hypothetical protein
VPDHARNKLEDRLQDETYRDWTRHDYSQRKLSQTRAHQATALGTLLGECRQTSDPKVARALARYEQLNALREMLEGNSP